MNLTSTLHKPQGQSVSPKMKTASASTSTVSPAAKLCPSIISASSSAVFSSVSAHPRPALKRGLSSIFLTAASTASTALPPCIG